MSDNDLRTPTKQSHLQENTDLLLKFLREESEANRSSLRLDADLNRKTFLDTLKIIVIPLTVVLAIAGFAGIKSAQDLMGSIREEGKRASDSEIERMRREIRENLQAQFEGPNIRSIVKDAARESTAITAAPLIKQEVAGQVRAQIQSERPQIHSAVVAETKKSVAEMQPALDSEIKAQANGAEQRIQAQIEPYSELMRANTLAALARNGDGTAFDELMTLQTSSDPQIQRLASGTRQAIFIQYAGNTNESGYLYRNFDIPITKDQMIFLLAKGDAMTRKGAIDGLTRLNDKSIVPTFIKMMRTDPSILVRQAAHHGLTILTGQVINPLEDIKETWEAWWEKNQSTWPTK